MPINWSIIPDWLSAIGTVCSLFAALYLVFQSNHLRKIEIAEKRQSVARKIAGWVDFGEEKWTISVKNASDEMIRDCVFYIAPIDREEPKAGEISVDMPLEMVFGTIPPGEVVKEEIGSLKTDYFGFPFVEIEFTDGAGRHWRRYNNGSLKEISVRKPFD